MHTLSFQTYPSLLSNQLPSGNTQIQLEMLKNFTRNFDEEMIKANRTADYRTMSRRIMDMTSVYNMLVCAAILYTKGSYQKLYLPLMTTIHIDLI